MQQGAGEKEVVRQHIKARMAVPETIANAPQLRQDLRWIWEAFSDLTTERMPGAMGPPGHIPWRAIHAYCHAHRIVGEQYNHFKEVIKAMDDAYLDHVSKTIDKQNKEAGHG